MRNICRSEKTKIWVLTVVNQFAVGILSWTIADRSAATFEKLWKQVRGWQSYFYITDGYKVYPIFGDDSAQIVSKTYMTRVEGENTRWRHYLARLHRKTLCALVVRKNAEVLALIIIALPQIQNYSPFSLIHPKISSSAVTSESNTSAFPLTSE